MADFRFKPISQVVVGDRVIGWKAGNGLPGGGHGQKRRSLVFARVVKVHKTPPARLIRITLASGTVIRCTPDHLWATCKGSTGQSRNLVFREAAVGRSLMRVVSVPPSVPPDLVRTSAWLGGLYDGEGSGEVIAQYQDHNPDVFERMCKSLDELGFSYSIYTDRGKKKGVRLKGGRDEYVRFVNWCDPSRTGGGRGPGKSHWLMGSFFEPDTVVKIEPDAVEEAYGLTTETGNYVAWGYASKNCWTFDPRLPADKTVPFDLYPRQEKFLTWLSQRETTQTDGLADKSRDVGLSWLCCAYATHAWLFRPGWTCGFGSHKLEDVDALGDLNTLLEKVRFLLDGLPDWMLPLGYDRARHALHCRIVHPDTGSAITGEGGDDIGRGGRCSVYFVDEAARVPRPELVDRALSQTTNVRIDISTPFGMNHFGRKRHSGEVSVFSFHWKDDPRKNHFETRPDGSPVFPWYEKQKQRFSHDPVVIAQELDLDYTASVEGVCIPARWVMAGVNLALPPDAAGHSVPRPTDPVVCGLDVAGEGSNESVRVSRRGPVAFGLDCWHGLLPNALAAEACRAAVKRGAKVVRYDVDGIGAGIKGYWKSQETTLPFRAVAVNAGETPTWRTWPDGRNSQELFVNGKAEKWWLLRLRFQKAYEYTLWRDSGGQEGMCHPAGEMISIPDDRELIAQLSVQRYEHTEAGKIRMVSKSVMRKEGVKNLDRADALVLTEGDMGVPLLTTGKADDPNNKMPKKEHDPRDVMRPEANRGGPGRYYQGRLRDMLKPGGGNE